MPELYAFEEFDEMVDDLPPAQMDLERVRYELLYDEELVDDNDDPYCHGLWRSVQKTFDPNPKFVMADDAEGGGADEDEDELLSRPRIEGELVAPEIKYVRFEYFDGAQWHDQWQVVTDEGGLDTGPQAAAGKGGYALPQAVRITLGQIPIPLDEKEALEDLEREEEEEEDKEHHPDRFTLAVSLLQADPSLMSSRQYGVADQLGRQEGVR